MNRTLEHALGAGGRARSRGVEDVLPGEAAVARGGSPLARRAHARRFARILAVPRPGVHRRRRLHRPGQLRDQHRGRGEVRLPAAVGRPRGEPDRDGRPDAVGEARHRHRQEPSRALPRALQPPHVASGMWIQAEIVAMSCDIAEVVGAALGLNLLFGIPLFPAALLAGAGAFAILALQQKGYRRLEVVIAVMAGVVLVAFVARDPLREPGRRPGRHCTSSSPASTAPRASCWRPGSSARR